MINSISAQPSGTFCGKLGQDVLIETGGGNNFVFSGLGYPLGKTDTVRSSQSRC